MDKFRSASHNTEVDGHLSRPVPQTDVVENIDCQVDVPQKKLWIGNLDKRLTEYQLVQILKKFGNIEKFEFLFHTSGLLKGEPRGYCFVEYKSREEAEKAMRLLKGKRVISKTLSVAWAKEIQHQQTQRDKKGQVVSDGKKKYDGKQTTDLSRESKIKALEAKLKAMEEGGSSPNIDRVVSKSSTMRNERQTNSHPYKRPYMTDRKR